MPKVFIERQLDDIPYSALSTKSLDLPRNGVYRGLFLRLSGSYTTGAGAHVVYSHPAHKLISRIEVIANGKDTIKSIPFFFPKLLGNADAGTPVDFLDPGIVGATLYPIVASAFIPFAFTRARRPIDGALDARKLSTLSLVVTWANEDAMYSTKPAAGAWTVAPKLEVKTLEYANVEDKFTAAINKHTVIQHEVTATKTEDQERLPVDRRYRRLFLYSEAAGMASNAIINKLTFKSGAYVFKTVKGPMHRSELKTLYGISTVDDGVYVLDNTTDGLLSESIDANGLSSLELVLDVTKAAGTNMVYIVTEEVAGL